MRRGSGAMARSSATGVRSPAHAIYTWGMVAAGDVATTGNLGRHPEGRGMTSGTSRASI